MEWGVRNKSEFPIINNHIIILLFFKKQGHIQGLMEHIYLEPPLAIQVKIDLILCPHTGGTEAFCQKLAERYRPASEDERVSCL